MTTFKVRMCRYLPDLRKVNDDFDFALICASGTSCALIGVNLAYLGLEARHPVGEYLVNNSFDAVWSRIDSLIKTEHPKTGFDILEHLLAAYPSNLMFTEIEEIVTEDSFFDVAKQLFEQRIWSRVEQTEADVCESADSRGHCWRDKPKMLMRDAELAT